MQLNFEAPMDRYDVVIIGGGPAGLAAAIYSSRAGVSTLLIEGNMLGGRAAYAREVDNYPGFPEGISGNELVVRLVKHAERFGTTIMVGQSVMEMELCGKIKNVKTISSEFKSKAVIIATGLVQRKLGIPGEDRFVGRGVSYCATCDGYFFRNKKVAVVGSDEDALYDLKYLSSMTKDILLIPNVPNFDREKSEYAKNLGAEVLEGARLVEVLGENKLTGIKIKDENGKETVLKLDGLFVALGFTPISDIARSAGLRTTREGYIVVNENMETNLNGVYAAGDCTGRSHQIIVAVGQGATAGINASDYAKNIDLLTPTQ
ncbi:MAG: thioredoxin reductase [Candidatus Methanomethylicota archaeon]|uniref:Thioredoxin reductase n=1 Tax=Thermoproteota archaeon TaxID=2056631 RepID=A0A523BD91_9CREN|nr:MAG: thioredoxin reductase [Candidatus Verstraetearchaeota archaeon]